MSGIQDILLTAKSVRTWRDMEIRLLSESGCDDLSYRPRTGMSSYGWVLTHQAAIYDFSLNMLIKQGPPQYPELFKLYSPGTAGDWMETPLTEILDYFDTTEKALLDWVEKTEPADFEKVIEEGTAPSFFIGMTHREVIANAFTHLNYHTGHLTAIRKDWENTKSG
ncbi:MAG: DinB family protein [Candidatus Thorarchaeota archaeon]|nr:MAG: DinB family protein [Candidatus Thorarchaeota archaeon]